MMRLTTMIPATRGRRVTTVGGGRLGCRLSLARIAAGEWRAYVTLENQKLAPVGYGVAATPWRAVQLGGGGQERGDQGVSTAAGSVGDHARA